MSAPKDKAAIRALQEVIRYTHGCESTFVERVPVTEKVDGQIAWEGDVHVFDLVAHPQAERAYVWSYPTKGTKRRSLAVLQLGAVIDPVTAVRAWIASR